MSFKGTALRSIPWLALVATVVVSTGCENKECPDGLYKAFGRCVVVDDFPPPPDGGDSDAPPVHVMDAGPDSGADAGFDASIDAGSDAGLDAGLDSGSDAGFDASIDAGFDAGLDAGFDAGSDAGSDADDAGLDAGRDGGALHDAFVPISDSGGDELRACDPVYNTRAPCSCEGSPGHACNARNAQALTLNPCCDAHNDDTCGVAMPPLMGPLAGCFTEHQPGKASESCGGFLDVIEGDPLAPAAPNDHANSRFDLPLSVGLVQLPACCTPEGVCGVVVDKFDIIAQSGEHSSSTPIGAAYGCVALTDVALPDGTIGNAATQSNAAPSPFCVPGKQTDDAACPPKLTVAGKSLCDTLPESALGCNARADTPAWVCLSHLSADGKSLAPLRDIATGELPRVGECMEYLPTSVHGCGEGKLGDVNCIANVPESVAGCVTPF